MAEPDVRVEQRIDAPADELYRLVSDLPRMGEWSPENLGGRWFGAADGPAVGARFRGNNRRGWRRWSTTCTVVEADPARRFAFDVRFGGLPISRWTYDFAPDGDATVVTESWQDRRPRLMALAAGPIMGVRDIPAHNRAGMETTLANLRRAAEK